MIHNNNNTYQPILSESREVECGFETSIKWKSEETVPHHHQQNNLQENQNETSKKL